jgi:Cof subfamily protein (haloacid dehalogenase superfamily)
VPPGEKKPSIRLLAVDVDGTLLDSNHELPAANVEALVAAQARGVAIVLVTGRRFNFVQPIAHLLPFNCFLITSNGAIVYDTAGEILFSNFLPRQTAACVLRNLPQFRAQAVLTFPTDGAGELVLESHSGAQKTFSGWLERNLKYVHYCQPLEAALNADPVQIMFGGSIAQMDAATAALAQSECAPHVRVLRTVYPKRDLSIIDVLHRDVSKGAALRFLAETVGVQRAQVMAIGDNFNDLEMLEFAGTAVLMGNAHAEMDRPGWLRAPDNDHAGVAAMISKLVLTDS